jgi:hypothetical protein
MQMKAVLEIKHLSVSTPKSIHQLSTIINQYARLNLVVDELPFQERIKLTVVILNF